MLHKVTRGRLHGVGYRYNYLDYRKSHLDTQGYIFTSLAFSQVPSGIARN